MSTDDGARMTITARFNGPGLLLDGDGDTKTDDEIPAGETFTTTEKRFAELLDQGIDVEVVPAAKADTPTPAVVKAAVKS